MESSSKVFRDNLSLQIKEKLKERNSRLEQAGMSEFSDKLKDMMKLEIMENFKKQIDEMRKTQGYDIARQAHLEVNRAKRNLNKANLEKEILMKEYIERLAKADENIDKIRKIYEEAEVKYISETQSQDAHTGELTDDNSHVEEVKNEASNDVEESEEIQEIDSNDDKIINDDKDTLESETENDSHEVENFDENNFDKKETSSENDGNFSGKKYELFGNKEAIMEDLKKDVTIEKCVDKTGYSGKKITINIPKVGNEFSGYKFECFVSDEKFRNLGSVKDINGRFFYRDDLYRLLDSINSYMNVYGITKDKFGYDRDMLGEIDNCVGMDCFKYITGLDSFYWLGWDFMEYKFNCTGKKQIFINKNKRAHLLLMPSK